MVPIYKKAQSDTRPEVLDTTSSKYTVSMRKNIEEKQGTNEDGSTYTYFEYDEAVLTNVEYMMYNESIENQLAIAELAEAIFSE